MDKDRYKLEYISDHFNKEEYHLYLRDVTLALFPITSIKIPEEDKFFAIYICECLNKKEESGNGYDEWQIELMDFEKFKKMVNKYSLTKPKEPIIIDYSVVEVQKEINDETMEF